MNINFQALGCRLNEAELETWVNQFLKLGHQVTTDSTKADIIVFNSCAVTAEADRKSRQQIGRLHRSNPQAKLVVTGCHASLNQDRVKNYLGVDMVVSNQDKDDLVEKTVDYFDLSAPAGALDVEGALFLRGRHRAFIKVQDGCRYRCTYCIVTIARGAERSRSIDEIIIEIKELHRQGIQEIVITGVHVGGYGSDTGSSLYVLLSEILARTEMPRIRLASVEPWDLPDNFFRLFHDARLMPHIHLPIQSGCDSVLRRMARRCKTAEFSRVVEKARSEIPLFNITTDIIVGFPGETEQEWQQTLDYVERTGFGHMHIFTYSPREGTKAAGLPGQIDKSIKKDRSRQMHELAAQLKAKELRMHLGTSCSVLWEQQINEENGLWSGYTQHYHKIVTDDSSIRETNITDVTVDKVSGDGLSLVNLDRLKEISVSFDRP
ncbi:MAG: tRNA (N(6)-L-threonylcarbamoyladenosine(37)-C(2))-methylthiotransferase MtaB [Gammaproteobacteria bacterium]|nr:MAG: tRNA (N(6)-L-threonylcarbamoyladenosine(37)-C(2))-methylthiotransferase MtaB [Gammaproteobacteria bacterium]